MKIGDIEYTRRVKPEAGVANVSSGVDISFALGIKVRPLLTRIQVWPLSASAVTNSSMVLIENGDDVALGQAFGVLDDENRAFPIWVSESALSTNGFMQLVGIETLWWKILMPTVRIHIVSTVLAITAAIVTLHYRFAELTDDEIIEIAAQRAQG